MCDKHNGNGVTVVKSLAGPTWDRGNCVSLSDIVATRERWRKHLHTLIKLVINILIWVKLYTFGGKYTHSGVNKSEMCSLEA